MRDNRRLNAKNKKKCWSVERVISEKWKEAGEFFFLSTFDLDFMHRVSEHKNN